MMGVVLDWPIEVDEVAEAEALDWFWARGPTLERLMPSWLNELTKALKNAEGVSCKLVWPEVDRLPIAEEA